jgi:hypothetical protein
MKIYLTRSSVCAADDLEPPHQRELKLPDSDSLEQILVAVIKSNYLPKISGGYATWSVTSAIPVAVMAQQWTEPRMLFLLPKDLENLDCMNGVLRLHFNYHAQIEPETVLKVLRELRLRAI